MPIVELNHAWNHNHDFQWTLHWEYRVVHKTVLLRTFAPIVSAHPYCTRNSLRDVMPCHVLSARAVEEIWRYIALVGT